ncbi:HEAT repeat-containing protein 5A [Orchesella cincta]|uniref:HEAT repeat-containing protein 5A n=1 Tax=Orchesella cincta TaxID=48709 RepID=A0A1D2M822_ORCCI|nr:HEAT repeat-containing protein 5A [Orchesella cincta]
MKNRAKSSKNNSWTNSSSESKQDQAAQIRNLVAQCMGTVFSIGDTITLFDTVNKCNDLLKSLKGTLPP